MAAGRLQGEGDGEGAGDHMGSSYVVHRCAAVSRDVDATRSWHRNAFGFACYIYISIYVPHHDHIDSINRDSGPCYSITATEYTNTI